MRSFGARGDGTTDDTAAIQEAINAAKNAPIISDDSNIGGSGGVVYLPQGVYRVTRTLVVQHDGVSLVGDGPATTTIKADANSRIDVIQYGPVSKGHSGRRSTIRGLSIYAQDTSRCRDAIAIDDVTWWRIEDVQTFNAGRYGLRVGGTINGTAINLRTWRSGDSGVFVDKSVATGTGETTTSFYALYSAYNEKNGVHVRRGHVVNFYSPIVEFNGRGGDPANGSGFKIGDQDADGTTDVWMYAPYFEDNLGWDIWAGDVPSARQTGWIYVYGGFAAGYAKKASGYAFLRADYARVHVSGVRLEGAMTNGRAVELNGYANGPRGAGGAYNSTFRDISAPYSALPVWKLDGAPRPLNEFNGYIEWKGPTGEITQFGRFLTRVGGPGSGESVGLTRSPSTPTVGVYGAGDVILNSKPNASEGASTAIGWRAARPGTAGVDARFEPLWALTWRTGNVTVAYGATMALDASLGDWFLASVNDGDAFTFDPPKNAIRGQSVTVTVRNVRGGGRTLSATDPFPAMKGFRKSGWRQPSDGTSRSITIRFDGAVWIETSQTPGDVPN